MVLLVILAVVVIAQGLSLWLSDLTSGPSSDARDMDVLLEVYGEPGGVEFSGGTPPELPLFDPASAKWTLNGQPVSEFAGLVQGLEVGPHGSSPFVIIAIPDDGTMADYRSAVASLSSHGICRVGVYSPHSYDEFFSRRSDQNQSQDVLVPVYRVIAVKVDAGPSQACEDRFPAWIPWAL